MPIYEYQCEKCGKLFEIFQKMSDKTLTECKECKGKLNKLISNCAFHLKGNGWYVTDYKKPVDSVNGKGGAKNTEKKETDTATEAKTEANTESTTDTKTETAKETTKESRKEKSSTAATGD
jgi:putative FmdB family regulatory protein